MLDLNVFDFSDAAAALRKIKMAFDALGGTMSSGVIHLSSAQLLNLANIPVQIVPAPGANKAIVPVQAVSTLTFGTHAYASVNASICPGLDVGNAFFNGTGFFAPFNSNTNGSNSFCDVINTNTVGAKSSFAGFALNLVAGGNIPNDPKAGPILTTTLGAGGSGYAPGDSFTVAAENSDASGTINTVDGGGSVLTFTITSGGTGYSVASGVGTTQEIPTGTGFTINITAVQPGDGTGTIEVFYRIVTWT